MQTLVKLEVNKENEIVINRLVDESKFVDQPAAEITTDSRFRFHGFGTFILKIQPGEIDATPEAIELLKGCINRQYSSLGDLFGLDISESPLSQDPDYKPISFTYGYRGDTLTVPVEDITLSLDAYNLIRE